MRIVGGKYRGKKLLSPLDEKTRPTLDKTRESIFNIINTRVIDSVVLDLFAGRGAFGIEALSRGGSFCFFNDLGKEQYKIISKNISNLGIKNAAVSSLDYKKSLQKEKYRQ